MSQVVLLSLTASLNATLVAATTLMRLLPVRIDEEPRVIRSGRCQPDRWADYQKRHTNDYWRTK